MTTPTSSIDWANARCADLPNMVVPAPGPISKEYHDRCCKHFKDHPEQVIAETKVPEAK